MTPRLGGEGTIYRQTLYWISHLRVTSHLADTASTGVGRSLIPYLGNLELLFRPLILTSIWFDDVQKEVSWTVLNLKLI